jgi:hypothetical protein
MRLLNRKYSNFLLIPIFIFIGFFCVNNASFAASINISPSSGSYNVGDTIKVKVYVDTNGQPVNAVDANVQFSQDTLELTSVSKTGSIITNWISEISSSNSSGSVFMTGGILGNNGYVGTFGTVATLTFRFKTAGVGHVSFSSASVLANDGNGTELLNSKGIATYDILPAVPGKTVPQSIIKKSKIIEEGTKKIADLANLSRDVIFVPIFDPFPKYYYLISIILILLCIIISIYTVLKVYKHKKVLHSKINEAQDLVNKSFDILEHDVANGNNVNIAEIKKDLKGAEKVLLKEVNEINKNI